MTSPADRVIASLRTHHDQLAEVVAGLTDDQLTGPSGASEWRLCDALSHLGSGSEIMLVPFRAAATGEPAPESDNQAVWDRWNAMSPREQADGFVAHDETLVALLEGLDADQRAAVTIDLGFLPQPVPLEVAAGMRLNEVAHHAWDVRVGLDPSAVLDAEAAVVLLDLYAGPLSFLLGFSTKPDALSEPTEVAGAGYTLVVDDGVRVLEQEGTAPTATFTGAPESLARLLTGRLGAAYTPTGTDVSGNVTLEDLRAVFPGY